MPLIIVVDDDHHLRSMLRTILEREGFEVIEAADGDAAIKAQNKDQADLIITDIVMPQKEGLETILELRRHHPQVKIIAMSGTSTKSTGDYLSMAKALGAHQTLAKPFGVSELLGHVKNLLQ